MRPGDWFILGLIIGVVLLYNILRVWKSLRIKKMLARAKRGEKEAVNFLQEEGYTILDIQKRLMITTKVDGKPYHNHLQADFIVRRSGKTYVVEVKTGKVAAEVTKAPVRRQLLEYYLLYRPHGILFLDMENRRLHQVSFQLEKEPWPRAVIWFYLLFTLLGIIIGWLGGKGGTG